MSSEPSAGKRRVGGRLETDVLAALHDAADALTTGQVRGRLDGALSYSTVVTVLTRLHRKGVLTREKRGRAYAYAPVADRPGLTARRMYQLLDAAPDRTAVLTRFATALSPADARLLRRLLGSAPHESR